ncbi:S8 family serine peptidase [Chitinimonas lacunae]|uniref:S8 family serine peptidase n=1 Tax=Chitinimonas lacunae TaxID=1963018 RepID=A0ABV8MU77_9NEIS
MKFGPAAVAALWWITAQAATGLVPDEILVKYRDGGSFAGAAGRSIGHGVRVESVGLSATARSSKRARNDALQRRLATLRADPRVEYAEPNWYGQFAALPTPVTAPNDPKFSSQDWLDKVGARQAWAIAEGRGVTVAVVDSGVDMSHPDLRDNLLPGFDFGDNDGDPQDQHGHGTRVAAVVAALRDNALGGSGLAAKAKVLPVKINPNSSGTFTSAAVAESIYYAVQKGARVINLSLEIDNDTETVKNAVDHAVAAGVIVVAAAGNQGIEVSFPATLSNVIAVASSTADDAIAMHSRNGPEVAIAAPGENIRSAKLGGGFDDVGQSGTSFAAPAVSAAVAALVEVEPRFDRAHIVARLNATGQPLIGETRYKRLDIGRLLLDQLPELRPRSTVLNAATDSLQVDFRLPQHMGPVDLYATVLTPFGEFALTADGGWRDVARQGYRPLLSGYASPAEQTGILFGSGGLFPALRLAGLPAGAYRWRIAQVDASRGALIGPVVESPFTLK